MHEAALDNVVVTLRKARDRGDGSAILIGAGCSVTAGIPTASGFIDEIRTQYQPDYAACEKKDYPHLMARLADGERRDVIAKYVDKATLNWAHIAIALLMKEGYIRRVLTTNFDPLIVRSCALVGVFPAVYDLAASRQFEPSQLVDPSVFYLHGQRAGFVMLNTEEEVQRHFDVLRPVFERAGERRPWLVVGYSGDNDPVFDHLAGVERFAYRLFWVGYKDEPVPAHVSGRLIDERRFAAYVRGFTADSFFVRVAQELGCFPPSLIAKPFSHLLEVIDMLPPFDIGDGAVDIKQAAQKRVQSAIEEFEADGAPEKESTELPAAALSASDLLAQGDYDEVIVRFGRRAAESNEIATAVASAYRLRARRLFRIANRPGRRPEEAKSFYGQAENDYRKALGVGANLPAEERAILLNGLATTLLRLRFLSRHPEARLKEAESLVSEARELAPRWGTYNLACIAAARDDVERCRSLLKEASEDPQERPGKTNILNDPNFATYRDADWFREFIDSLP
ncbi:MAG TPA: hypothetical protein VJ276_00775 [Thermoanaerobaculia bacterium]|nr:hypothetical protein [Thermoanaerobaculia bacterium]